MYRALVVFLCNGEDTASVESANDGPAGGYYSPVDILRREGLEKESAGNGETGSSAVTSDDRGG
jgi:hypothetical protein